MAKHKDVIHHFAPVRAHLGQIKVKYIASAMNIADSLTQAVFEPLLEQHRAALGLHLL